MQRCVGGSRYEAEGSVGTWSSGRNFLNLNPTLTLLKLNAATSISTPICPKVIA